MKIVVALVLLVIGSLVFHWLSPWWMTPLASNWQRLQQAKGWKDGGEPAGKGGAKGQKKKKRAGTNNAPAAGAGAGAGADAAALPSDPLVAAAVLAEPASVHGLDLFQSPETGRWFATLIVVK